MPSIQLDGKEIELREGQEWFAIVNNASHCSEVTIEAVSEKVVLFKPPEGYVNHWPYDRAYMIGRHVEFIELLKDA